MANDLDMVPGNSMNGPTSPATSIRNELMIAALLDGVRWLEFHRVNGRAIVPHRDTRRYRLSDGLCDRFMITYDERAYFVFASYAMRSLAWFPHIPWKTLLIAPKQGIMTFVSNPINIPPFKGAEFKGKKINPFAIDLPGIPGLLGEMGRQSEIDIGQYLFDPELKCYRIKRIYQRIAMRFV